MLFFEILYDILSHSYLRAMSIPSEPQKDRSIYYFYTHRNGAQHVPEWRSWHIDRQSFMRHECLGNNRNIILITGINRILPIFSKSRFATSSHRFINVKINHIYIGIFAKKQSYNNIPYRNEQQQWFFDVFCRIHHDCSNMSLYGSILIWEYVYIIYFSNLDARGLEVAQ